MTVSKRMWALLAGLALSCAAFAGDVTISALPSAGTLNTSDAVPIVQGGQTKRATVQQIQAAVLSGLSASATTDTTNADNISSGTVAVARLPGYRNVISATLSTTQNNYAPSGNVTGSTNRWFLTAASGGSTITGMAAESDGFPRLIINASTTDYIFFTCGDTNSVTANRNLCVTTQALGPGMADIVVSVAAGWRL